MIKIMIPHHLRCICLGICFFTAASARAANPSTAAPAPKKVSYPQFIHTRVLAALNNLTDNHDYPAAKSALQGLFDQAVLYAPQTSPDSIREADFALRLVSQLDRVPPETRNELLPFLREHEVLARTLVFLIHPDQEKPGPVYALLNELRQKRAAQLDSHATLAAAICVVHSRPFTVHVNENSATSTDPIDLFDYYVRNEGRMFYGIQNVPAEMLIYVVDSTATIGEMEWALNKYAGKADVGALYFDINYDYDALKTGTKKLTSAGFNLPNILQYGGVCIDQAYFSATVGKAIGVPTAIDLGESAEAGHAWLGFLQYNGKTGSWNFDTGRYESFQGVRGTVRDPQSRQDVPDCYVTLLGEIIGTRSVDRQNAVALTDAATRVGELQVSTAGEAEHDPIAAPSPDTVLSSTFSAKPRSADVSTQLALIESALRQSIAYTPAWFEVRDLAVANKLTLDQKRRWSEVLIRLGAAKYPDFTLSILMPMVKSVDDPEQQNNLLNNLLPLFQSRLDLSASIRMAQASLWESQNQDDRAGECYLDVVQRFTDAGPFVLRALQGAEKLLRKTNRADRVVLLYQQAWSRTSRPGDWAPVFVAESNWYRIGQMYAKRLTEAGQTDKAAEVKSALDSKSNAAGTQ
jgi:hypothetical protein